MHAKRKEEGGAGHAMPITFVIMIITLIITLLRALQLHTKVQEDKFNLVIMIILSYSPTPPTTGGTSTRGEMNTSRKDSNLLNGFIYLLRVNKENMFLISLPYTHISMLHVQRYDVRIFKLTQR